MGLENCKGMGGRMEQKDLAVLKAWWRWKLQINKSWLCRKPILKYYIALRHSSKSVCTCTIQKPTGNSFKYCALRIIYDANITCLSCYSAW
jgi:hypothetical protein